MRAIKRSTGGRDYQELQASLLRLQTTSITTSIRATTRRQKAGLNWLDSWTFDTDAETEQPRGMTLTLSDWVYEGTINEKSLLTMHPDYFLLSGGLERALYRIARKHAGQRRGGRGASDPPKEIAPRLNSCSMPRPGWQCHIFGRTTGNSANYVTRFQSPIVLRDRSDLMRKEISDQLHDQR